ncbi:hypothetical protein JXB41_05215 [Candidatus Woesearchaeota archaeon]|nr:hypothetical protein [Candidatus Woesearchaeota archaeon]
MIVLPRVQLTLTPGNYHDLLTSIMTIIQQTEKEDKILNGLKEKLKEATSEGNEDKAEKIMIKIIKWFDKIFKKLEEAIEEDFVVTYKLIKQIKIVTTDLKRIKKELNNPKTMIGAAAVKVNAKIILLNLVKTLDKNLSDFAKKIGALRREMSDLRHSKEYITEKSMMNTAQVHLNIKVICDRLQTIETHLNNVLSLFEQLYAQILESEKHRKLSTGKHTGLINGEDETNLIQSFERDLAEFIKYVSEELEFIVQLENYLLICLFREEDDEQETVLRELKILQDAGFSKKGVEKVTKKLNDAIKHEQRSTTGLKRISYILEIDSTRESRRA